LRDGAYIKYVSTYIHLSFSFPLFRISLSRALSLSLSLSLSRIYTHELFTNAYAYKFAPSTSHSSGFSYSLYICQVILESDLVLDPHFGSSPSGGDRDKESDNDRDRDRNFEAHEKGGRKAELKEGAASSNGDKAGGGVGRREGTEEEERTAKNKKIGFEGVAIVDHIENRLHALRAADHALV